jgi:hypothetical protein
MAPFYITFFTLQFYSVHATSRVNQPTSPPTSGLAAAYIQTALQSGLQ